MKHLVFSFLSLLLFFSPLQAQIQSPDEFLGYELGSQWTPHHRVMDYFGHLAEDSELVSLKQYGTTYQGRKLVYAVLTTADNHSRIDDIRANNLKLTGLESGEPVGDNKAIVWLSYNVHGNETSSSEAAMKTAHALITEHTDWLDDVVVIMDPMVNPDGRQRYVSWYRSVAGATVNPAHDAREHHEPWPGGRVNHYYFDLNRDWAWQTQIETQQRIKEYNRWMPHIHVDFHEQYYNSPYYFAPAAEPFHNAITEWQRDFQTTIGKNHATYFDRENWLYFTKEVFDLFYPSYGDTWPIFNGAIGMTYEQAGHSFAGLGVLKAEGDTLTLRDRLIHHHTTGLSTIEVAANHSKEIVSQFANYFEETRNNGSGEYRNYIISKNSNPDKVTRLLRYLNRQDIRIEMAANQATSDGYNFSTGETGRVNIQQGDYVISTYQPKGNLVRVLFEPNPALADSMTYDLTAWEAHYAFGVQGYAVTGNVPTEPLHSVAEEKLTPHINKPYAYLAKWNALEDLRFLSRLLQRDITVRYAQKGFSINGESYRSGTLIITRNGNEHMGNAFDETVKNIAGELNRIVTPVATGFVDSGKDFGSSSVRYIEPPKVALLSGKGTDANTTGQIWHYFDQQIEYPLTMVGTDYFSGIDLEDYQVLILPSVSAGTLTEDDLQTIQKWITDGGKLITVGESNRILAGKEGFGLTTKEPKEMAEDQTPEDKLNSYGESSRKRISTNNAGSVFEVTLDTTHPLAFGYDEQYLSLKTGSTAYGYLDKGWNVGTVRTNAHRSGFVGYKVKQQLEHSLSFGVENMGKGQVIYMADNPLFRGFWHNGKLLFGNAVFLVGN